MIQAIIDQRDYKKANTEVSQGLNRSDVYLHDHHIASYYHDSGELLIANAGWKTNTTKSRLNVLIQFVLGGLSGIYQKDFEWYLKKVDGSNGKVETSPVTDTWLLV